MDGLNSIWTSVEMLSMNNFFMPTLSRSCFLFAKLKNEPQRFPLDYWLKYYRLRFYEY